MRYLQLSTIVGLLLIQHAAIYGQAGLLDTSFNANGIVTTHFGNTHDFAGKILVQPDQKIILVGWSYDGVTENFAVARYLPDGSLDAAFGNAGKVITDFAGTDNTAGDGALQTDGKILAVGSYRPVWAPIGAADKIMIARYLPDGSLDSAFGTGGIVTTGFNATPVLGNGMAVQADGKIVVVGSYDSEEAAFITLRYLPIGSLDPTFGTNGVVITALAGYDNIQAYDVVIRPNGRIVVFGNSIAPRKDLLTIQYLDNGTIDPTFANNGVAITDFGGFDFAKSIVHQADGAVVIGGVSQPTLASGWNFAVARLLVDGTVDNSFGSGGKVQTAVFAYSSGQSLAIQPDGKIVFAGYASDTTNNVFAIVRYQTNGSLDPSFGTGGIKTIDVGFNQYSFCYAAAIQSDGKILAAGSTEGASDLIGFAMIRLLSGQSVATYIPNHIEKKLLAAPNPVASGGLLTVNLELPKGKAWFELMNVAGITVQTFPLSEKTAEGKGYRLHITALPSGVYFLKAVVEGKNWGFEKVVVK